MHTRTLLNLGVSFLCAFGAAAGLVPAPDDQEEPSIASSGNGYFTVWADKRNYGSTEYDIYGSRVSASGQVLDPDGIAICTVPERQTSPRVAFDGTNYLVVWEDDRHSTSERLLYQIYGARVSRTGVVLDPNGFRITTNGITSTGPAVASNGRGFYVVWTDWMRTDNSIADIFGSPVSSEGHVANPSGLPLVQAPLWQVDARIASANGEFLVTYHDSSNIKGLRLSSEGTVVGGPFGICNSGSAEDRYGVASNGREYFVTWGDTRGSPSGFGYPKIYGTLVRGTGQVVNPSGIPIATSALYQNRPKAASDGNDFLVAWQESNDAHAEFTDIKAARITADGALGTPSNIGVNQSAGVQHNVDVAFAGTNYLVAWQDARSQPDQSSPHGGFDIYGTLVSSTGTVANSSGFLISSVRANQPPTVRILAPSAGQIFTAPAQIQIYATADDPDGYFSLRSVEFFANNVSLGIRTNYAVTTPIGPFFLVWGNVPAGEYVLTAKAVDALGASTFSTPVRIFVEENSSSSLVTIEATDPVASESGDSGTFTITREGGADGSLEVHYLIRGTASNGIDYQSIPSSITIPPGASSAQRIIVPKDDSLHESMETVSLQLRVPLSSDPVATGYRLGSRSNAVVQITDNDPQTNQPPTVLLLRPETGDSFPANSNIELVASAFDREDGHDIVVEFLAGTNRIGFGTFQPTLCPTPECPSYNLTWSNVAAGRYSVRARATDRNGATTLSHVAEIVVGTSQFPTVWIETRPEINPTALEYCPPNALCAYPNFIVHRTGPTNAPLIVLLTYSGTASNGVDYRKLPSFVTIPSGATSTSMMVLPIDDLLVEGTETVVAHLIPPPPSADFAPYWVNSAHTATISINDNDPVSEPIVSVVAEDPVASETSMLTVIDSARFRISRTGDLSQELEVFFSLQGSATEGDDYLTMPHSVRIPAGQPSAPVHINPRFDSMDEGMETVVIRLEDLIVAPANRPSNQEAVAIILDRRDDTRAHLEIVMPEDGQHFPVGRPIRISAAAYHVNEDLIDVDFFSGEIRIGESDLVLGRPISGGLLIHNFTWTNPPPGQHSLTARGMRHPGTSVVHSAAVNITVGTVSNEPMVRIVATQAVAEENSGFLGRLPLQGLFTVSRTGPTNHPLSVFVTYTGTATPIADYQALPTLVIIPAGSTSVGLRVVAKNDGIAEANETVVARLSECPPDASSMPCVAVNIDPAHREATVTVRDGPQAPASIRITRPVDGAILEEAPVIPVEAVAIDPDGYIPRAELWDGAQRIGISEIVFIQAPAPGTPIHHQFEWRNAAPGTHVLTVRATDARGSITISAPVTVQVRARDVVPVVSLHVVDPFGTEPRVGSTNPAIFRVRRTGPTNTTLVVRYSTHGTAQNGIDYALLGRELLIPAGRRSATIIVQPHADNTIEGIETVILQLDEPMDQRYRIGQRNRALAVINEETHVHPADVTRCIEIQKGLFHICLPAGRDGAVRLERSSDLTRWEAVMDGVATNGFVQFVDEASFGPSQQFYRLVPLPIGLLSEEE